MFDYNIAEATQRLVQSKARHLVQASTRGREVGIEWAAEMAHFIELQRLATLDVDGEDADVPSLGLRTLAKIMDPDGEQRSYIMALYFLANQGIDIDHEYVASPDFWDGFAKGALTVYQEINV